MRDAKPTVRRARVAGVDARWLEAGEGPPVVLLASSLVRAESYRRTLRALAPRHRVLVVELPGSGRSSRVGRGWSIEETATWTAAWLEALALPDPVVVGHSNSGAVALAVGAQVPERVGALVLVGAIGAHPRGRLLPILLGRLLDGLIELRLTLAAAHHVLWNALVHTRNFVAQVRQCARTDLLATARRVTVPVLLAWGRRDHTMPLAAGRAFAAALPRARWFVHPRGSHDWLVEHPRDFALLLDRFARRAAYDPDGELR